MSDQLLTPEELDLIAEGLGAGAEIERELAERLIATLRAAWAERDEARGHVVWWHGEWCKASDEITRLRAAAPVPTGWVPVDANGAPEWDSVRESEDEAWDAAYDLCDDAPDAGWRVVPCAALTGEEVPCEQS